VCRRRGLTVATAESCTGGLVGAAITSVPGSSEYFRGGIIAYDNEIKTRICGVPWALLAQHGAVSAPVARALARGVRKLMGAGCAVAVTGIAGPGGGTKEKPVGLVYIGVSAGARSHVVGKRFSGSRETVRRKTVHAALQTLIDFLQ
jgi:PncC family amidohydrolase